jgi:hypothetical protein
MTLEREQNPGWGKLVVFRQRSSERLPTKGYPFGRQAVKSQNYVGEK